MATYTLYSEEIADRICEDISTSARSLKQICMQEGMPSPSTVNRWIKTNADFRKQYGYAKQAQAHLLADEILEIIDDTKGDMRKTSKGKVECNINLRRAELRVEGRKWIAARLAPKKYGLTPETDMEPEKEQPQYFKIRDKLYEF